MDEEDLEEQAESKKLEMQRNFQRSGGQEEGESGLLEMALMPSTDTIGVKLLRRMGWRDGQGIGPRVTRLGDDQKEHSFAPSDTQVIAFSRKSNSHGLGYEQSGASLEHHRESKHQPTAKEASIDGIKGGMGVGVLNDDGEDDEDPFTSYNPRGGYDRVLGGSSKQKKKIMMNTGVQGGIKAATAHHSFVRRPKQENEEIRLERCNDGRIPLQGFALAVHHAYIMSQVWFDAPKVPEGWQPKGLGIAKRADAPTTELDAKKRGALLGETALPGKSVFDYLKPEMRDKIREATGRTDLPPALGEVGEDLNLSMPKLLKDEALSALQNNFMPYADDPKKRLRYRRFLEAQASLNSDPIIPPPEITRNEWRREMAEFVRAAQVFKPMSKMMASRFTSSTNAAPTSVVDSTPAEPVAKDTAVEAAKMNMFGHLTRSIADFYPARLLCKRFNVRDPKPFNNDVTEDESPSTSLLPLPPPPSDNDNDLISKSKVQDIIREVRGDDTYTLPEAAIHTQIDPSVNEALEAPRPSLDVFAAVFGDDDDDI